MSSAIPTVAERRIAAASSIDLTGCFCPFRLDEPSQPVPVRLPGVDALFVTTFSERDALDAAMDRIGWSCYAVKVITDGVDFVASVHEAGRRVMHNPRIVDGRTVWTEAVPAGEALPGEDVDRLPAAGGRAC